MVENVVSSMRLFGVVCRTKPVKDDKYCAVVQGRRSPLYESENDVSRVYVEASRREKLGIDPVSVKLDEPSCGLPIVFLKGMDLREVLAEKLRALLRRKERRDLYDLWFLLGRKHVKPSPSLTRDKLSFYNMKLRAADVKKTIEAVRQRWSDQLRPIILGELPSFEEARDEVLGIFPK